MNTNGEIIMLESQLLEGPNTIRDLLKQEEADYANGCSLQTLVNDEITLSVLPKNEPFQPLNIKIEPLELKLEAHGNVDAKEEVVIKEEEIDADESSDEDEEEESSADSDNGDEVKLKLH